MASGRHKSIAAEAVCGNLGDGQMASGKVKERRRKLIAAINASQSERADEADAALTKTLDNIYPETRLSDQ